MRFWKAHLVGLVLLTALGSASAEEPAEGKDAVEGGDGATCAMLAPGLGWDEDACYKNCKDKGSIGTDCWNCCYLCAGKCNIKSCTGIAGTVLVPRDLLPARFFGN